MKAKRTDITRGTKPTASRKARAAARGDSRRAEAKRASGGGEDAQASSRAAAEPYMTVAEIAEHLRVAPATVRRWAQSGEAPHYKIVGSVRFRASEVQRWIETGTAGRRKAGEGDNAGTLFDLEPPEERAGREGQGAAG